MAPVRRIADQNARLNDYATFDPFPILKDGSYYFQSWRI